MVQCDRVDGASEITHKVMATYLPQDAKKNKTRNTGYEES